MPKKETLAVPDQELVDNERKTGGKTPKETPEELQECEMVFQVWQMG